MRLTLLSLLLLAGCSSEPARGVDGSMAIKSFKDDATGLCYSSVHPRLKPFSVYKGPCS